MRNVATISLLFILMTLPTAAAETPLLRCQVVPKAGHQVAFTFDGIEKCRWHFREQYPRPFLFPLNGPSGTSLTRMGHPGAPNHDHHRSVWFAFHKVNEFDFWADGTGTQIRQLAWKCYQDGPDEAVMAVELGWFDPQDQLLIRQEAIIALRPMAKGEYTLEIQSTFRPGPTTAKTASAAVDLGKTNFGFLAVRVAKSLSGHFGGGIISDSEGRKGEKNIFGRRARWMDYSGPVVVGKGAADNRQTITEGITFFDHPNNPRYPTRWHVREDGWMGASFCMDEGYLLTEDAPLTLRYQLHVHSGHYDKATASKLHDAFRQRRELQIVKANRPHVAFDIRRDQ